MINSILLTHVQKVSAYQQMIDLSNTLSSAYHKWSRKMLLISATTLDLFNGSLNPSM